MAVSWSSKNLVGAQWVRRVALGLCVAAACLAEAEAVHAEPSATGKGIAGGTLLGAELAVFGEAIGGIETPWLYWVGAGAAAGGGAFGGYYIEGNFSPRASYYLLTGGMALSIPAMIVYLDATNEARSAETGPSTGRDYDAEPLDELDGASLDSPLLAKRAYGAPLDWEQGWRLQAPSVVLSPTHTPFESAVYGAPASTRVWFPLVSGAF